MWAKVFGGIVFAIDIVEREFAAVGKTESAERTLRQSIYGTDGDKSFLFCRLCVVWTSIE